tara:strand:+ start:583 stop:861 length:279 start_codon:yes stop_codon:yes gene_type:complete
MKEKNISLKDYFKNLEGRRSNMSTLKDLVRIQQLRVIRMLAIGVTISINGIVFKIFTDLNSFYLTLFGMGILIISLIQIYRLENLIDKINSK